MDADSNDKLEYEWVKHWPKATGNNKIPQRVMQAYADLLDLTINEIDKQLCWECWPEGDASDNEAST